VAVHDWATWHRTTNQNLPCVAISFIHIYQPMNAMCRTVLPIHLCHVSYGHATSASVRTIQSTFLFLPVCHFEQNVISLVPDVRLNPNELRWVCNDETYALVRFEAITSTLNFLAKFDPLDHTSPLERFWTSKRLFLVYLKMRV
jgi:hypothetical protein